ncbi:MAG: hypothetical protein LBQ48_00565, partial [Oscillospiraceae bacterium]|jgi:hypothetical protein|nr:hypothetical protein [Oscillospiraceae bacterium]
LASLILFSFLFAGISVNEKRAAVYFKGILLLLLLEFAAILVVSALYGLIAVLIQAVLKSAMAADEYLGVIKYVTNVLTFLMLPVLVHLLMVFATAERKVIPSVSKGLKTLKNQYVKVMLAIAFLFAAGELAKLPFGYITQSIWIKLAVSVIMAAIGAFGIVLVISLYPKEYQKAQKKASKVPLEYEHIETKQKEPVTV